MALGTLNNKRNLFQLFYLDLPNNYFNEDFQIKQPEDFFTKHIILVTAFRDVYAHSEKGDNESKRLWKFRELHLYKDYTLKDMAEACIEAWKKLLSLAIQKLSEKETNK